MMKGEAGQPNKQFQQRRVKRKHEQNSFLLPLKLNAEKLGCFQRVLEETSILGEEWSWRECGRVAERRAAGWRRVFGCLGLGVWATRGGRGEVRGGCGRV